MLTNLPKPIIQFLLLPLVLVGFNVSATTLIEVNIDDLAKDAEVIFEGEVIEVSSRQDNNGTISTFITFTIADVIKGDLPGTTIELKFLGGESNGRIVAVSGLQQPELGEVGIYFVESTTQDLINPLLGWSQGHFLIQADETGARRVTTSNKRPVTDVQSASNVPAAIKKPLTLLGGNGDAAAGITTEEDPQMMHRALSADQFKSRIKQLIEP
jgi:hypothetical protein